MFKMSREKKRYTNTAVCPQLCGVVALETPWVSACPLPDDSLTNKDS